MLNTKSYYPKIKFIITILTMLITFTITVVAANQIQAAKYVSPRSQQINKTGKKQHTNINDNFKLKMSQPTKDTFKIYKYNEVTAATNTPNVNEFNATVNDEYKLLGTRWESTIITYNTSALDVETSSIVSGAVNQINRLNLVKLVKTDDNADITFNKTIADSKTILGNTEYFTMGNYKSLNIITHANITLYSNNIKAGNNTNLLYNQVVLHELGHALGLAHTNQNFRNLMSPTVYTNGSIMSNDKEHTMIDQSYVNALATLYKN